MVVVAADQILDHVVGQELDLQRTGDLDSAGAADDQSLHLLGAHQSAEASAAGVTKGGNHTAHRNHVLASETDGSNVKLVASRLGQGSIGLEGALAPNMGSVLDGDLVVVDLDVDRLIALAFQDQCVIASVLEGVRDMAAHVRIDDGEALGPAGQERDVHTAGARNAGSGQRTNSEDSLRLRAERVSGQRNLVPDDLVAKAHAADKRLILRERIFSRNRTGGQVDAKHRTSPAVDAILNRHFEFLLYYS